MSRTVVAGGRLVLVEDGSSRLGPPVDLYCVDGAIEEIAPARTPPPGAVDASGLALLPGLVNGHTHSHEGLHRGRYRKLPLERWMHHVRPPVPLGLTADEIYHRTAWAGIEALLGGATTVVDDVGLPGLPPDHLDAVLRAYRDVGIRAVVAPTMADRTFAEAVPFLAEGLSEQAIATLKAAAGDPAEALDALELALDARTAGPPSLVRLGVAASAPQRCSDDLLVHLARLAERADVPLLSHVLETRAQAATAQLLYGTTMVEHLERLGVLGPRLTAIHGIWLTSSDVELLAARGATVQHNPVSNLRLGSGVGAARRLRDAGVHVSLGTDGVGSSVCASMLATVREAALLSTVRDGVDTDWLGTAEALEMATVEGARALGHRDLGRIEPGWRADVIGVPLDDLSLTPVNDPLRQVVHATAQVRLVVVDGRAVVEDGRVRTVDQGAVARAVRAAHRRFASRMEDGDRWVDEHVGPAALAALARLETVEIPADTVVGRLP